MNVIFEIIYFPIKLYSYFKVRQICDLNNDKKGNKLRSVRNIFYDVLGEFYDLHEFYKEIHNYIKSKNNRISLYNNIN